MPMRSGTALGALEAVVSAAADEETAVAATASDARAVDTAASPFREPPVPHKHDADALLVLLEIGGTLSNLRRDPRVGETRGMDG